ncbi:hypothetical protein CEXT_522341 [Caerostris extrusa]|uniref:Uncharacterized protein n=1 Tax=Caerostris extrusa TaxID=172846 RepID=A0AAV4N965_CAEEX|nr:hypothetical protein CEXT_522341 [Caerostris extrusa]
MAPENFPLGSRAKRACSSIRLKLSKYHGTLFVTWARDSLKHPKNLIGINHRHLSHTLSRDFADRKKKEKKKIATNRASRFGPHHIACTTNSGCSKYSDCAHCSVWTA